MRDMLQDPEPAVAAERARVATEGWGARLLALQGPDGRWGIDALPKTDDPAAALRDPATRRRLRELDGTSLEDLSEYLGVDGVTLAVWESGELDPDGEQ